MSDLQGRIWSAVAKATHAMPNYERVSHEEWLACGDAYAAEAADRILAAVREALLAPEAVEAMVYHRNPNIDWIKTNYPDRYLNDIARGQEKLIAALDAAGIGTEADDDDVR